MGGIEDVVSPVLHLRLAKAAADADAAETTLQVGLPVLQPNAFVGLRHLRTTLCS